MDSGVLREPLQIIRELARSHDFLIDQDILISLVQYNFLYFTLLLIPIVEQLYLFRFSSTIGTITGKCSYLPLKIEINQVMSW